MRIGAAALVAAGLTLPPCTALAERDVSAIFEDRADAGAYSGDWPIWSRMRLEITRRGGSAEAIFRGHLSTTWQVDADEGGFFLGNRPEVADVNGDGKPEVVVIQHVPSSGWRMAAYLPPGTELGILGEAVFAEGVDQAVLLGVIDPGGDDGALIGVVVREKGASRLLIYSFQDNAPGALGPYPGYGAGPAGSAPRVRVCRDQRAFLVANAADGTVTAIGRRGESAELRLWNSTLPATEAGFAKAASCD
ncbi:hypothetical protein [Paracoccus sp. S1E-3]|uniref:hypothetical protein n=1 Tax=Paracoccus sp. S1E-3 TaxID=2756130 RepID=UPI0015EF2F39|nr:hypothetical protein [Paracoccus sp. S1E-3]MBA4489641.1 hypothetical protein [Paracoccus sp. S1E-3]